MIPKKRNNSRNINRRRQTSLYSRTEEIKPGKNNFKFFNLKYILGLLIVLTLFYLVFISPIFLIKEVNISETKFIRREEVQTVIDKNSHFFNKNIVTFGFWGIRKPLKKIVGVADIKISRKSLSRVDIELVEEFPLLSWQTLDKKYLINQDGAVWAVYEDRYSSLPVVFDNKNLPVSLGDKILPNTFVVFFRETLAEFNDSAATKITKYEVLDIVSDLKVTTEAGWYVIFDTSRTAKNQLISLKRVLEEARIKGKKLEYIDLRIDSRIFYR